MEHEMHAQAIRELEQMEVLVPDQAWAHAEAKILLANAYGQELDELKGMHLLEEVLTQYRSVEGGRFIPGAEEALFQLLFDSAERLKINGDYSLAEARYRKALLYRPDDVRVHRGLIDKTTPFIAPT